MHFTRATWIQVFQRGQDETESVVKKITGWSTLHRSLEGAGKDYESSSDNGDVHWSKGE